MAAGGLHPVLLMQHPVTQSPWGLWVWVLATPGLDMAPRGVRAMLGTAVAPHPGCQVPVAPCAPAVLNHSLGIATVPQNVSAASEPSVDTSGSGDQVVAVPWQGPLRFPSWGGCQCHPRPGTSRSSGSTFPLCLAERYPSCLVPICPWRLVQALPRMAEPAGRMRPRTLARDAARTAGTGQRCRHRLNEGTLCT